jgi:hypothetical protein
MNAERQLINLLHDLAFHVYIKQIILNPGRHVKIIVPKMDSNPEDPRMQALKVYGLRSGISSVPRN